MNDDLISRKALLKQFSISDSGRRIPEYDIDNFPITLSIKDVKEIVRKAPTAFDMEKVIDELQKPDPIIRTFIGKSFTTIDRAIEIVEKGGIG